ncbi:MAG: hypothetical protein BJ554DRAFT_3740 [Olpidium bornovanus]|uniref:GOST seven transmembrane domain-containing protein n=1 Tax=Olpidium bornovanus TaxID=278681 RepID=A0A8H8A0J5_9FUNG|nr:MAG: hypothetical protein BJ554DRAFT_3740 [Olpidium bornovanus]
MSFNYGYWSDYNSSGQKSSALLALVVLLNAARTSISLFVLLIVALGYGVVNDLRLPHCDRCWSYEFAIDVRPDQANVR